MNLRWICCLTGCVCDRYPDCVRCGTNIYDSKFVERESSLLCWWYALVNRGTFFRAQFFRRCAHCNKIMLFDKGPCCSEQCWHNWLPF